MARNSPDRINETDSPVAWFEVKDGGRNLVNVNETTGEAGALGHVHWLTCCSDCLIAAEGDATKVDYAGTVIWGENKPVIREGS